MTASSLPYELPDFAGVGLPEFRDAIETGLAEHGRQIEQIAANPEPATFENTIEALERAGDVLDRAATVFWAVLSADGSDEMRAYDVELAPVLSQHQTGYLLHPGLWARIEDLHERRDQLGLTPEQAYVLHRHWTTRRNAGAGLGEDTRAEVQRLTARIATLQSEFENRLIADTNDGAVVFDSADELDGLTPEELGTCAEAARARSLEGKYLVDLLNFTNHPFLSSLTRRESRKRLFDAQRARGHRGNQWDTSALVLELVELRAELAQLFGYGTHVARKVADETARTPEAIERLVYPMAAPARRNADAELARLQAEADRDAAEQGVPSFPVAAWDWSYYAERVRAREFALDAAALKPWFEYNRVLVDGVFYAATRLYGITFTERSDLAGYHPDVRVFEVFNEDGSPLGLFLHDVYTRDTKRGGAWMNNLVDQSRLLGRRPVVCNNLNVPKPRPGEPTLLTLDNVRTMFHEFGHALHGLFSDTTYPSVSGTATGRDFVEFPSQVNEMWILWPEVLDNYARHYETGEPLPREVVQQLRASEQFNEGFATSEYLAAALLDQEWHKIAPGARVEDVDAFEAEALARVGLDNPAIPPRYSTCYFAHTFGGGYDGAYYSYIWSEVLDADTVEWFKEHGGLTRENGQHFRDQLLSRGRSREPLDSYRAFRGRDAEVRPLLERRGLLGE
ncbi:MAG TPA: M3 family metallopeptidase [Propionibacteriaceae bacterium]|nr:M3 family metallopeptidase [Propionibacteriaceae bacterium]